MRTLLTLLILSNFALFGQTNPKIRNIQYQSDFERQQFHDHFNQELENYLELFVASSLEGNSEIVNRFKKKIDEVFDEKYQVKLLKKSPSKRVKSIYETIHSNILDKYESNNTFINLITTGSYNCVTATALYALMFEKFNIPYLIQEKPTHVYVVAYPSTEQILVESTDPVSGFLAFNERYKSDFIKQMTKAKIIGSNESTSSSVESLFDQYYFRDTDIDMVKLVGIQYMNQGIYAANSYDLNLAMQNFEKAFAFYPSRNIESVLLVTRLQYLALNNFKVPNDAFVLAKLEEHKDLGITDEIILNEFHRVMQKLLIENSDVAGTESLYNTLTSLITDQTLLTELSHLYYYERARVLHNEGEYDLSLTYSSKALELRPKNKNTENLFLSTLTQKMRTTSDFKAIQQELETFLARHGQLREHNVFTSMLANTYLILFGQSYDFRKISEGDHYHDLFQKTLRPGLNIDQNTVGRAYSIAAVYYFRLGQKNKSLKYIEEGLSIAPGNFELQTRKRMIIN
ncbi:MAG: hypothetical protein AAGF85_02105 [Bacteroidota bacterium]